MTLFGLFIIVAAVIILVTSVARLNDIKRHQTGKRWWARRLGLLMVAVAMGGTIASFFTVGTPYWRSILQLLMLWGFALTWITTPGMPPWSRYITRYDPKDLPKDEQS